MRDLGGEAPAADSAHRPMAAPLWAGFARSAQRFAKRDALWVGGRACAYAELDRDARAIAATLQRHAFAGESLTAVFAYRSATAFAGVLGALLAGRGYVPLNPNFPLERTRVMFERAGCRSIVLDASGLAQLDGLLDGAAHPLSVVLPEEESVEAHRARWPTHEILGRADLEDARAWRRPAEDLEGAAYLLFTSGSTGVPKGITITHRNASAFIGCVVDLYAITEHDRFSQMFDMTFDLSVFDMFACWERGGLLCCPSQKTLMKPGRFIADMALTIWFSVPSTAMFMKQLGALGADRYPSLRLSLFCGEPLPASAAIAWRAAAPNAVLENLYGPTEVTVACTRYRWDDERSPGEGEMGIVPIGRPFAGMSVLVADENLREVGPGETGELLMSGPQTAAGYWRDEARTAAAFVRPPGCDEIFYRTGDRVRRPNGEGPMTHLGRLDFQVKVLGHRVELGEVEAAIRAETGAEAVVAVGWPPTTSGFGGVEAFIEGAEASAETLRAAIAARLPDYMTPRRIHALPRLPRNANEKLDRKALVKMLEDGL